MGLIREPRNVDFYIQSRPLTDKDHKDILEFIKKRKAANLAGEKRKKRKKNNELLNVDYIQSKPMTEQEHKELSEHIKKSKAEYAAREKRKAARQQKAKPARA